MCGIVGIAGPDSGDAPPTLARMLAAVKHRGPDDDGTYHDTGIALGHARLAIIDLSPGGHNPMFSGDGRYVMVYNGEVFNYLELRAEIGRRYAFRSQTDTEVILAAYTLWGPACLDRLVGMFSFAIWDRQTRTLFCARDRLGIKPFYYAQHGGRLVFGSEIKALLAAGVAREPDYATIHAYLKWGIYDHSERTFFRHITALPAGHTLVWRDGAGQVKPYWDLVDRPPATTDPAACRAAVLAAMRDTVRLTLRADVPVGVNLSGGLDSSALAVLIDEARRAGEPPLEGFTQDYREADCSERPWVEEIAERTRRPVTFSYITPADFQTAHACMDWYQDEPYAGLPVAAYTGIYQSARERGITVLLDGNGLDEAFGGYRQYHAMFLRQLADRGDPELDRHIAGFAREWSTPASAVVAMLRQGQPAGLELAKDGTQAVQPWMTAAFAAAHDAAPPSLPRRFASPLKEMMYRDIRHTKIPRALRFNDRISMAYSRELRVPFLDHRLLEMAFALPDHLLFDDLRPKGLVRAALNGLLPDRVRLAPKRHIQSPQSAWLAGPLLSWVMDVTRSAAFRERGIFDPDPVAAFLAGIQHRPGRLANSFALWQIINLESWFAMFIDAPGAPARPAGFPVIANERMVPGTNQT